jgi:hypothetical protein
MCVAITMLLENIVAEDSGYTVRKLAKGIGSYMVSLHKVIGFYQRRLDKVS